MTVEMRLLAVRRAEKVDHIVAWAEEQVKVQKFKAAEEAGETDAAAAWRRTPPNWDAAGVPQPYPTSSGDLQCGPALR